jgi:hypothetical protein
LLESESNDGSNLDEDDDAWENLNEGLDYDDDEDDIRTDENQPNDPPFLDDDIHVPLDLKAAIDGVKWKFRLVTPEDTLTPEVEPNGTKCRLKSGVATSFRSPPECLEVCGGLLVSFVVRVQAESNNYYHKKIKQGLGKNGLFHGIKWENISKAEMYRFFGIILRISMNEKDGSGYKAYFAKHNRVMHTGVGSRHEQREIPGSERWAWRYMSLRRFQQIRAAFHPEKANAGLGGDKCYQLPSALNHLNAASKNTFMPGGNLAFDEGGVACRSRLCPVRQYNKKDKPQKYRVDFFILADSSCYTILHMDVYQGRNAMNVNIDRGCLNLPTTMKAVVNAVFHANLVHKTEDGYRCILMDNRYQCPELAVLLMK